MQKKHRTIGEIGEDFVDGVKETMKKITKENKKEEPVDVNEAMAQNRSNGNRIVEELELALAAIDDSDYVGFGGYKDAELKSIREDIQMMKDVTETKSAIFDDIGGMDGWIIRCANALTQGLKENRHDMVNQAVFALKIAISDLRENIPDQNVSEQERKKDINDRTDYMEKCYKSIKAYEAVDKCNDEINNVEKSLKESHEKYDPLHNEIKGWKDDPSGIGARILGAMMNNRATPANLQGVELEYYNKIDRAFALAYGINAADNKLFELQNKYSTLLTAAETLELAVLNCPYFLSIDPVSEAKKCIIQLSDSLADVLEKHNDFMGFLEDAKAERDRIRNSPAAQERLSSLIEFVKSILEEENHIEDNILAGQRMIENIHMKKYNLTIETQKKQKSILELRDNINELKTKTENIIREVNDERNNEKTQDEDNSEAGNEDSNEAGNEDSSETDDVNYNE